MTMTDAEYDFWITRVADYVFGGLDLHIARRLAEDDLDLWREYGDEANFSELGEPDDSGQHR